MVGVKYHLQEQDILEGYQIYDERVDVVGIQYRRDNAISFVKGRRIWLEPEAEPTNEFDNNAIKVIGFVKGWFGAKKYFVGYLPREIAKKIADSGIVNRIKLRLLKTYLSEGGFVEITLQVLGPRSLKELYFGANKKKGLKRPGKTNKEKAAETELLISDLLKSIEKKEKESLEGNFGVPPASYERLAKVYRKNKRYADEIEILERFFRQKRNPGAKQEILRKRLERARELLAGSIGDELAK